MSIFLAGKLGFDPPSQQVGNHLVRRLAGIQERVHLLNDGHLHPQALGQGKNRPARTHSFSDHRHSLQHGSEWLSPPEPHPDHAIPAQDPPCQRDQKESGAPLPSAQPDA